MKIIVQIKSKDYQPGIEDKIKNIVENITKEEVPVRVVQK